MKIDIELVATYCNTWPTLVVEVNGDVIYRQAIKGQVSLNLKYDLLKQTGNRFVIGMEGKQFGNKGVWDTKSKNNKIIEDKTIEIRSLKLDDVDCKKLFANKFYVKRVHKQPSYFPDVVESNGTMNYNGYFTFGFDLPLYNSLINNKFKVPYDKDKSYFSNYTKVFHYDEEISIINCIKGTLKKIHEESSNKRTKTGNSPSAYQHRNSGRSNT